MLLKMPLEIAFILALTLGYPAFSAEEKDELLTQSCITKAKDEMISEIKINHMVRNGKIKGAESVELKWRDKDSTYPTNFFKNESVAEGNIITKFKFSYDHSNATIDLQTDGEVASIYLTLQADDDGVGAMVYFLSDGPRKVGFQRCDNFPTL